ncbi:MAG: SusC/RagA family TonB-linked outer membrane protein [Segetibacter sp.]
MIKKLLPFFQRKKKVLIFAFFFFSALFSFAQQKTTINGKVFTTDNAPLAGVSVNIKGRVGGTTTDADGKFTLQAVRGETLVFSFVGYEEKQVKINNANSLINLPMVSTSSSLGEVVVVGYGSQRKRDITAAVSTVDVSKLKDIPVANVSRLLSGQASGVTVKQVTGSPGQEFEVTIRGTGSLGAGSQPLYVIDGFPVGTSIGQNLNPNDIATITILKDAVSTAIYGARGSNGVVLITTKKAKNGEVSLTATANYGIQNIPESRKTKVLNGVEFAQFKKDIFMDKIRYFENREPAIDEVPLDFRYPEQTKISTNWFDAILNQNAKFQNYNITLSEGKGDIHSLVSVGYVGQEGALIKTKYDNFSARANIGGKINNFISMGLNVNGSYSRQNTENFEGRANLVGSTLLMDPRQPIYNEDGTYNSYIGGHDGVFGFPNPVQSLNEILRNREIGDVLSNGF